LFCDTQSPSHFLKYPRPSHPHPPNSQHGTPKAPTLCVAFSISLFHFYPPPPSFLCVTLKPGEAKNHPPVSEYQESQKYFCKNFGICYIWLVGEYPTLPDNYSVLMIEIQPTNEHPVPTSLSEQVGQSLQENVRIAAMTSSIMAELGMPFEMTEEDDKEAQKLFAQFDKKQKKNGQDKEISNPPALYQGNVALKLAALLTEYDHRVVVDATQARTYIMNRLLELSTCGDTKSELRALELIGKMSDIGAFTEKSEITITHRSSSDLQHVIEQKINRLLSIGITDVTPKDIKKDLGIDDDDDELAQLEAKKVKDGSPEITESIEDTAKSS